ncbi:hypothetical protein PS2_045947 [Malus domestica]
MVRYTRVVLVLMAAFLVTSTGAQSPTSSPSKSLTATPLSIFSFSIDHSTYYISFSIEHNTNNHLFFIQHFTSKCSFSTCCHSFSIEHSTNNRSLFI